MFTKIARSDFAYKNSLNLFDKHIDPDDLRHIQQFSSMAKISGSDIAMEVAYQALQIAGLESSLHRYELEKIYRDAKLTQIYEGTNELNRHNIFMNYFPEENAYAG
jgi:alkylation response protein AidB-like acyl-CoA dehydrogenase